MIDFLQTMPWYTVVSLVIFTMVAVALFFFSFIRKVVDGSKLREDQEIISYALNTVSLFYCVLVGLVVVDVQSQHNAIQDNIVKEASILMDLHHTSRAFSLHDQELLNKAILRYANNVIEIELPLMQQQQDYALVRHVHAEELWNAIAGIDPKDYKELAVYQNLLNRMNDLTNARFQRFTSVDGRTTTFLWAVLIYGGIVVIACSLMFASKSKLSHVIHLSFNVSLISLILLLIYALDLPFSGPTAVPLTAFEEVINDIQQKR